MKYESNKGNRDRAIRMGCENGVYQFIHDYAVDMGMSASAATRRLVMIGARCEAEHGKATMPASYAGLSTGTTTSPPRDEFWEDDENVDYSQEV